MLETLAAFFMIDSTPPNTHCCYSMKYWRNWWNILRPAKVANEWRNIPFHNKFLRFLVYPVDTSRNERNSEEQDNQNRTVSKHWRTPQLFYWRLCIKKPSNLGRHIYIETFTPKHLDRNIYIKRVLPARLTSKEHFKFLSGTIITSFK